MAQQSHAEEQSLADRIYAQSLIHSDEEDHELTHDYILCYAMFFLRLYFINNDTVSIDYLWYQVK